MAFVINELADLQGVVTLPAYQEMTPDLVAAVLDEAGKFANAVLAPLNRPGDQQGASWSREGVTAAEGGCGVSVGPWPHLRKGRLR
jgi:acyl-CoA dehydrogenase